MRLSYILASLSVLALNMHVLPWNHPLAPTLPFSQPLGVFSSPDWSSCLSFGEEGLGLAWKCQVQGRGALFSWDVLRRDCVIKVATLHLRSNVGKVFPHTGCALYKIQMCWFSSYWIFYLISEICTHAQCVRNHPRTSCFSPRSPVPSWAAQCLQASPPRLGSDISQVLPCCSRWAPDTRMGREALLT